MIHHPTHVFIQMGKGCALILQIVKALWLVVFVIPYKTTLQGDAIIQIWCRQVLNILNLRVNSSGYLPIPTGSPIMFVSNHISWLDVLILNAVHRLYFVAKAEIRSWPIIGRIVAGTGTIFLERDRIKSLAQVRQSLTHALREGKCVGMFPEGTTTDGSTLKSFHSGLFQAAVDAQAPVRPVTIKFTKDDGTINCIPAFLGNQSLIRSILNILAEPETNAEIHFGRPLQSIDQSRWELVRGAEHAIASRLQLIATPQPSKNFTKRPRQISLAGPPTVA